MVDHAVPVCVWLKRDLRVVDHPALAEAVARARGGAVFAVFLYESEVLAQPEWDPSHAEFQRECLADVDASLGRLGIRLVTRRGEAVAMLDLPPLNEATSGARIPGGRNQGRARDATREAGAGGADHSEASRG